MLKIVSILFLVLIQLNAFTEIVPKPDYMGKFVTTDDALGLKPLEYEQIYRYTSDDVQRYMINKPQLFGKVEWSDKHHSAIRVDDKQSTHYDILYVIGHNFLTGVANLLETFGLNNFNYLGNIHRNLIKDGAILNPVNEDGGLIPQGIIQFAISGFVTFIVFAPILLILGTLGFKGLPRLGKDRF